MSPCDNCPVSGPTQPFDLPKGARIEIHCHPEDHHLRNLGPGQVRVSTTHGGEIILEAGQSLFIRKDDRHSAVAIEATTVHCDFGPDATEAATHPIVRSA